jgi:DNA-binding GntR family transcriptional regulator
MEAVEHRDPSGAREAMKAHLRQVREDSRNAPAGDDAALSKSAS